jgi:hypothetical protein
MFNSTFQVRKAHEVQVGAMAYRCDRQGISNRRKMEFNNLMNVNPSSEA